MNQMKRVATEGTARGGFVIGMVCGAAVGAAVGLLLAPQAGAALRQRLGKSADRLRQFADDEYTRAAETVTSAVDDVIERGAYAVERGQETYQKIRRSADGTTLQASDQPLNERA